MECLSVLQNGGYVNFSKRLSVTKRDRYFKFSPVQRPNVRMLGFKRMIPSFALVARHSTPLVPFCDCGSV